MERRFALLNLRRGDQQCPAIVLLLERSADAHETVPPTLLSRLAEGVRSDLALGQAPSDSLSDSSSSASFE